jgi:hypothetical protein
MKPFLSSEDIERKTLLILRILSESREPMGARLIARRMQDHGISMSERTVRYHLRLMDEKGRTVLIGNRDGRIITPLGSEELENARVHDKIAFAKSRIEMLAFRTSFDPVTKKGVLPVNVSVCTEKDFPDFITAMRPAFEKGLYFSDLIGVAGEGDVLGTFRVPEGKMGLATVCSVAVNGVLLKSGIPIDSKFGGILQVRNGRPLRFSELIYYSGSSLNPSEAFVRARMTSVRDVIERGEGKMLANFRELPLVCREPAEEVLSKLGAAGIGGIMTMGEVREPVCQIPVDMNKIGMILIDGLNPIACAQEMGFEAVSYAMSDIMAFENLQSFESIYNRYCSIRVNRKIKGINKKK